MAWFLAAIAIIGQVQTGVIRLTDRDLVKNLTEDQARQLATDWKVIESDNPGAHTKNEWVVFAKAHGHLISVSHNLDPTATALILGSSVSLPKIKDPNAWVAREASKFPGMRLVQVTISSNSQPTRIFTLFETLDLSKGLTVRDLHRRFDGYVRDLDRLARSRD